MPDAKIKEDLMKEIERVLDVLREGIMAHSGNVELVDVDMKTGIVSVRLQGACVGCPLADLTLKDGIEETLMMTVPEVKGVIRADETSAPEFILSALAKDPHPHDS
jgi:NFU1 iron-sulfur cluster scaffold homolog, mitochondrial